MKKLVEFFAQIDPIYIAVAIVVILLLIIIIYRSVRKRQLLKKLHQIEVTINSMRSTPLQYKINKAVGLTKVNQSVESMVGDLQKDFAQCTNNYDRITYLLGHTEDELVGGKLKSGKQGLVELEEVYQETKVKVEDLIAGLDRLLEDETRLRDHITQLKNDYREHKVLYQKHLSSYGDTTEQLENIMADIEQQFNSFEEWMFASEFDKAQESSDLVEESIANYGQAVNSIPSLLEKAKGVIPHLTDEVSRAYQNVSQKGVFLNHLEVAKNLQLISDTNREDLVHLREVQLEGVEQRLQDAVKRLQQLLTAIQKEDKAFDMVVGLSASSFTQLDNVIGEIRTIDEQMDELSTRFGFNHLSDKVNQMNERKDELAKQKEKLASKLSEEKIPSTTLQIELNEFSQSINQLESEIQDANRQIASARADEQRASKQLLKLNLIMNDISIKIDSRHLPHIAQTYDADVAKSKQMIHQIEMLLSANPLNIEALNSAVNTSIDYVYRLYNNVNNLVGTVDMVENAIVYANKYRSSYPELDSELTRAEVAFRNGEYTYALKTVIYAIDKIKPGSPYEQLIMDNSRSA